MVACLRAVFFVVYVLPISVWADGLSISEIKVNNIFIKDTVYQVITEADQAFTIHVTLRDSNAYEYKLEGIDRGWTTFTRTLLSSYYQLPGGRYSILIRRKDSKAVVRKLVIEVHPLVWQKWWFLPSIYLLTFLLFASGLYFAYLYRLHQQIRLQHTRDRIARDLHDDMGSYLSSISILSQTAHRSAVKDPAKTQATLDRIGQTARQVMDSMGDIVWSINPDHDSMAQVIARMTDVASRLFADDADQTTQVALEMDVSEEVRQLSLSAECRRDFFLIYKEAITNVARYAQASRVQVRLRREGGWLDLMVQDNGRGFDPQNPARLNPSGGNGLRNMQTRATLLNGTLRIESEMGQGTTVVLRFPV